MGINKQYAARTEWKCDICGKVDFWGEGWSQYSSLLIDETCPQDALTTCSDACKDDAELRLNTGQIRLPVLKINGYNVKIKKPRKGY